MKTSVTKFSFWIGNKKVGLFQLNEEELINFFKQWLPSKTPDWLERYSITDCINCFIAEHLNSIGNTDNNFAEYRKMEEILEPIRDTYCQSLEKKN